MKVGWLNSRTMRPSSPCLQPISTKQVDVMCRWPIIALSNGVDLFMSVQFIVL